MPTLRRVLPALLALASLPALVSPALAQYSIANIKITGAAPYTDPEILSVAGLQPGQLLAHDSLVNAAQHLLDTGLFDDAQISTAGQGKARTVVLELKPTPLAKLLPGSFANFIWFTPEELTAGIHTRVPLFRGVFSDAGNFPDTVQTALEQMLAEKGLKAAISHTIVEPTTQHPRRVVTFTINSPRIFINSATITGIPADLDADFHRVTLHATNLQYNEGLSGLTTEEFLLRPARDAGYIAAKFDAFLRTPIPLPHGIGINFTAHLTPGPQYKISTLTWTPTPVYSAADFTRDAQLRPGDIASDHALQLTEAAITTAYHAQGYLDAYFDPSPTLDTTAHTVAYNIHANPGDQYRFHAVTAVGLSPEAQKEFDANWKMKPNDLYNESYVASFITNNSALPHLRTYQATYRAAADPQTHIVELTMTFTPTSGH